LRLQEVAGRTAAEQHADGGRLSNESGPGTGVEETEQSNCSGRLASGMTGLLCVDGQHTGME
jgi:hypothetical protein